MVPAAPSLWLTATQAPRSSAVQARTAAGAACEVSAASTAPDEPDEPAATAAEVAISPAAEAAAITAAVRRAVFGIMVRYFMLDHPVMSWDPRFTASSAL